MAALQRFADVLFLTSATVALLHLVVPDSVLDKADRAVWRGWNWLSDHGYERFRQAAARGERDGLITRFGLVCIVLNFIGGSIFKIFVKNVHASVVPGYFLLQALITVLALALFQRLGVPMVRWIFTSPRPLVTAGKAALMFGSSLVVAAASFFLSLYVASMPGSPSGESADAYGGLVRIFDAVGPLYAVTVWIIVMVLALVVMIFNNGVFPVVTLFYIYLLFLLWVVWALLHAFEYLLRRSLERKGAAALLAVVSAFFSALLRWSPG